MSPREAAPLLVARKNCGLKMSWTTNESGCVTNTI
ncbi:hypothetical protein BX592_110204 [Paraburkholderia rhizosphaerae]|uniref:Uncharacterized protein n=1 Tax=Paraburkholderia rhizosphaerae TaxID=480658 RepID=A0A4R8LQV8_9BURK|nr:hypothetical protein BX592_110204 [Paraburkholderia rhizosphaerae]